MFVFLAVVVVVIVLPVVDVVGCVVIRMSLRYHGQALFPLTMRQYAGLL